MIISFVKGIQILIFIPAFILSIFLYSVIELYFIDKSFWYNFYKNKNWNHIKIYLKNNSKYNFIIWNKLQDWTIEFLEFENDLSYTLKQDKEYNLILYVFWSFDIFRKKYEVWKLKLYWINNLHDFYLSEKYSQWEDLSKLDNLKSSLYNIPYIKKSYDLWQKEDFKLKIISNSNITPLFNKYLNFYHLFLIILWTIWIVIEWYDVALNILLGITFIIVFIIKKQKYKIKNIYKNYLILFSFIIMISLTFINKDMSWPWSVFLIQILLILYLFPKDFRNSFLFIFLILFIFVAISLFSNQIRFIILFLIYIFISIYLLFFISWSESFDQKIYKFWTNIKRNKLIKTFFILTFFIFLFFIILPHWNKVESDNSIWNNKNEWTISGFNEEISLENVQKIMEDSRKVIVIENITKEDVLNIGLRYFRGMRSNYFDWSKWIPNFEDKRIIFQNDINIDEKYEELKIKYYLNWSKNIFLPSTPLSINSKINFYNKYWDNTTLKSYDWINEILTLDIKFKTNQNWKIIDKLESNIEFDTKVNKDISNLFSFFIKNIPNEYKNNPELISNYIKNEAWLEYSSEDIATDINDFLYWKKQGHCEYFATTLAIILQEYWFNATVVSGYSTWEYNNLASSYIVRAKNAHAWVELYDEEKKQRITLDPTPWDYSNIKDNKEWITEFIIKIYDYIDIKWYTYVVNYTWEEQKKLYLYLYNNKNSIFYYTFIFTLLYIIFIYILKIKFFFRLTKKEKILFLLSKRYNKPNDIIKYISNLDKDFSIKLKEFVYWDKWKINYTEVFIFIIKK